MILNATGPTDKNSAWCFFHWPKFEFIEELCLGIWGRGHRHFSVCLGDHGGVSLLDDENINHGKEEDFG